MRTARTAAVAAAAAAAFVGALAQPSVGAGFTAVETVDYVTEYIDECLSTTRTVSSAMQTKTDMVCPGPLCTGGAQEPDITVTQTKTSTICSSPSLCTKEGTSTTTMHMISHYTTYETVYEAFCSTGLTNSTFTVTETCADKCKPLSDRPATALPPGFTVTVTDCNVCGPEPITATLTVCPRCGVDAAPASPPVDSPAGVTTVAVSSVGPPVGTDSPMDGGAGSPMPGSPDSPMDGGTGSPMPGSPDSPMEGGTDSPVAGNPDSPMAGSSDSPMAGTPDSPIEGGADSPVAGSPDSRVDGGADSPMAGTPDSPMAGSTDSPMDGSTPGSATPDMFTGDGSKLGMSLVGLVLGFVIALIVYL